MSDTSDSPPSSGSSGTAESSPPSLASLSPDSVAEKSGVSSNILSHHKRAMSRTTNEHDHSGALPNVSWNEFRLRPSPEKIGQRHTALAKHVASSPPTITYNDATAVSPHRYSPTDFYGQENESERSFAPSVDDLKHRGSPLGGSRTYRPALQDRTNMQPLKKPEPAMQYKFQTVLVQPPPIYNDKLNSFRPMDTKLGIRLIPFSDEPSPKSPCPPLNEAYERMLAGFSPNYRGNIYLARNRSADIPDNENCALFVIGLSPTITVTELLAAVRDTGRVYATHINSPEPHKGHETCAAKLIFFERRAAERFYDRHVLGGLKIPGHPGYAAKVVWNRIKSAAPDHPKNYTRVLMVAGPVRVVNPVFLTAYFKSKLQFDIDEVFDRGSMGDRRLVEYRFGSFRCQAEAAKMSITREFADCGIQVWFGPDPCDAAAEAGSVEVEDARRQRTFDQGHPACSSDSWRQAAVMSQYQYR
ncbi:hypothetical protein CONLIGDRAFT_629510 [Coniochaeta ligniaria NRRL 30616]|uniref:RRM domain-containing protein n=1 Tax=Coniochaeta ligniaria NRRL 30616 TaxID=1408157 RepID=A0A1J7JPH8_9PEZI|nr:hypothetical protein CONLIGDRAFT_629510 [Coniochaeta ligniaria NRRL 30616]